MPIELLSQPEIDRSRKGILAISAAPILHGLLGFPPNLEIAAVGFNQSAQRIEVLLEGADMPACGDDEIPQAVTLIAHRRENELAATDYLEWAHQPGRRWLLDHRPKAGLCAPLPVNGEKLEAGFYWVRDRRWDPGVKPVVLEYSGDSWNWLYWHDVPSSDDDIIVMGAKLNPPLGLPE